MIHNNIFLFNCYLMSLHIRPSFLLYTFFFLVIFPERCFSSFEEKFHQLERKLIQTSKALGKGIKGVSENIVPSLMTFGKQLGTGVKNIASSAELSGKAMLRGQFGKAIKNLAGGSGDLVKNVFDATGQFSSDILSKAGATTLSNVAKRATSALGATGSRLLSVAGQAGSNSLKILKDISQLRLKKSIIGIKNALKEALKGSGDSVTALGKGTADVFDMGLGKLNQEIGGAVGFVAGDKTGDFVQKGLDMFGTNMAKGIISDSIAQVGGTLTDLSKKKILTCAPGIVTCTLPETADATATAQPTTFPFDQKFKGKCVPRQKSLLLALSKCSALGGTTSISRSSYSFEGAAANSALLASNLLGMESLAPASVRKGGTVAVKSIFDKIRKYFAGMSAKKSIGIGVATGSLLQQDNKEPEKKEPEKTSA